MPGATKENVKISIVKFLDALPESDEVFVEINASMPFTAFLGDAPRVSTVEQVRDQIVEVTARNFNITPDRARTLCERLNWNLDEIEKRGEN